MCICVCYSMTSGIGGGISQGGKNDTTVVFYNVCFHQDKQQQENRIPVCFFVSPTVDALY